MVTDINKSATFVGFGFLVGLFFSPIIEIQIYILMAIFIAILFLAILRKSKEILFASFFVLALNVGFVYFKIDDKQNISKLDIKEKTEITFQCRVFGDVEYKNSQKRFQCRPILGDIALKESLLLYTKDIEKDFLHSDVLSVRASFSRPKPFKTDTGADFDYDEFLKTKKIFFVSFDAKINDVSQNKNNFRRKLFYARDYFINPFTEKLKGDSENLFVGILFGKNVLSKDLAGSFRDTGLTHIIALSGYNITVIASWVRSLTLALGVSLSVFFSIFSIVLFILMTGIPITAVRAGIMAGISLLALRTGNMYASLRALFITVIIMNIVNPRLVFFDFSFQLSVLATLGIIVFTKKISDSLPIKKPFWLKEIITTTVSAQIAVLPLILYQTKLLSVFSLPANMIVLPVVPIIMLFGFLGGLVGLLSPLLAFPFVLFGDTGLRFVVFVARFVSEMPTATIIFKEFGIVALFGLYGAIIFWVIRARIF